MMISSEALELKPILCGDMQCFIGFPVTLKCLTLNDHEMPFCAKICLHRRFDDAFFFLAFANNKWKCSHTVSDKNVHKAWTSNIIIVVHLVAISSEPFKYPANVIIKAFFYFISIACDMCEINCSLTYSGINGIRWCVTTWRWRSSTWAGWCCCWR